METQGKAQVAGHPGVTYTVTEKIRTWGGWHYHALYYAEGRYIGQIQTSRKKGRLSQVTLDEQSASGVLGADLPWLLRLAGVRP